MINSGFVEGVLGNKRRRTKKILLWTLLIVQVCLIFCFWCMQTGYTEHPVNEINSPITNKPVVHYVANMKKIKASPFRKALETTKSRVNFITKKKQKQNERKNLLKEMQNKKLNTFENVSNFTSDFVEVKIYRLINTTEIESEMTNNDDYGLDVVPNIWCYRQGTFNDTNGLQIFWNTDTQQPQCNCQQFWHGKDCSQNEVIYRALMLPRNQFTLRDPIKAKNAHLLVYMLEGYFSSLDFLELQIKPMATVVDYFLILLHGKEQEQEVKHLKALKRKLSELVEDKRYTLYYCESGMLNCNRTEALAAFRMQLLLKFGKRLETTDLLLHTYENVLLSADVLRFFKYYAPAQFTPCRFRLKYNVYGFFWQHPDKTYLDGYLSSFGHLDEPVGLTKTLNNNIQVGFSIIGDLNHFGGWYCQYCAHPDEIIAALDHQMPEHVLPTSLEIDIKKQQENFIQLPQNSRNTLVINSKYMEYLIAQGLLIDGKTRLQKVRLSSDAYFAPIYADKFKWKFGNLLANLFEAMENDYVLDEAEGGFGF